MRLETLTSVMSSSSLEVRKAALLRAALMDARIAAQLVNANVPVAVAVA